MTKQKKTDELAVQQPMLPAAADLAEYSGYSANEVLDAERIMPVLQLVQTNSKALVKSHEKFVPGAQAGMFLNRGTGLLAERVVFVPCEREHCFVEWVPMDKGGGKVGTYPIDDKRCVQLRQEQGFGKLITPEGNEIQETFYVYGYTLREEDGDSAMPEPAVLAIKGSSITPYRQFFNQLRSYLLRDEKGSLVRGPNGGPINPPLFAHRLVLSSQAKSSKGNDFLVFKFASLNGDIRSSMVPPAMLAFGKQIADDFKAGRTRVEEDDADSAPAAEGTSAF